jgi:hypothetical protein
MMFQTQDVALRSLERRGDWSRLAFAWSRAGETWKAYSAAVRATQSEPDDSARVLIVPTELTRRAPWSGLQRVRGMRTIATGLCAETVVDLGRGLLAIGEGKRFVVVDIFTGRICWERPGLPLGVHCDRVVILVKEDIGLVEVSTGLLVRRWAAAIPSRRFTNEGLLQWVTHGELACVRDGRLVLVVTSVRALLLTGCTTFAPHRHVVTVFDLETGAAETPCEFDVYPGRDPERAWSGYVGSADVLLACEEAGSTIGVLKLMDATTGKLLSRIPLKRFSLPSWYAPLVVAGRIVLRGGRRLVVIEGSVLE